MAIKQYLEKLLAKEDLSFEQSNDLLDTVLEGKVQPSQVAAFLTALRMKGETIEEIAGLANSLRSHAVKVETGLDNLVDTCGTGGARLKTFNISTAAAFVAAGAGVYVAKHGNRGITSKCGSADVLKTLGVNIECSVANTERCIKEAFIGFMFAPMYHPAMKYVQPIRKELDFRTAFNILGPLANPAMAAGQVMGVAEYDLMPRIAEILKMIGIKNAMVVHSEGLDEISTLSRTKILRLIDGNITQLEICPEDFGMTRAKFENLEGGDSETNAAMVYGVIEGKDTGPRKDIVVLNAAASIIVAGLANSFEEGIKLADKSITNGNALRALNRMIEISNL